MKIGLASTDWAVRAPDTLGRPTWGGAGWYRLGLPGRHLGAQGFDVVEGTLTYARDAGRFGVRTWPAYGDEAEIHWDVDLIVLQRWMLASVAVETSTARRSGQVVVQDVDDHFWALDPRNRAYLATDPRRNPLENRDYYLAGLKEASAVTVSTSYLADALRRLGVRVPIHVIENRVDVEGFRQVRETRPVRPSPVLGWIGATAWRSGDLETLRGVLGPFLERHDLRAYHGGHLDTEHPEATFAYQADVEPGRVTTAALAPIESYPLLFRGLDVGLVPLRDVVFNRAKSAVKGLEYAAAGVPFVAQDLPQYVRLQAAHGIGHVARRPRDWLRLLERLLDPAARAEDAERGLEQVKALDISQGLPAWRDLYLDLLANA